MRRLAVCAVAVVCASAGVARAQGAPFDEQIVSVNGTADPATGAVSVASKADGSPAGPLGAVLPIRDGEDGAALLGHGVDVQPGRYRVTARLKDVDVALAASGDATAAVYAQLRALMTTTEGPLYLILEQVQLHGSFPSIAMSGDVAVDEPLRIVPLAGVRAAAGSGAGGSARATIGAVVEDVTLTFVRPLGVRTRLVTDGTLVATHHSAHAPGGAGAWLLDDRGAPLAGKVVSFYASPPVCFGCAPPKICSAATEADGYATCGAGLEVMAALAQSGGTFLAAFEGDATHERALAVGGPLAATPS